MTQGDEQMISREECTSPVVNSGLLDALSLDFAEGFARIREVTDVDGACPAWAKALYMAAAAAAKGHLDLMHRELARSAQWGLTLEHAKGASIAVLISRGEAVFGRFWSSLVEIFGVKDLARPNFPDVAIGTGTNEAIAYFKNYFGVVPDYIEFMAKQVPLGLEGYFLMRQAALESNALPWKHVELLLVTVNAAEMQEQFVRIHAMGARKAGASQRELAEAAVCAIPVAGVASWIPAAKAISGADNGD